MNETALETANIFNIFTSVQGEGIYLGVPQVFIRFTGCNIRCNYCDTAEALLPQSLARIEETPFCGNFNLLPNPLSVETILETIGRFYRCFPRFHSVSLTGGEPLLYAGFLSNLLPGLKENHYRIFLETNGTLPEQLDKIKEYIDIISMDIKIPSSLSQGVMDWGVMENFLRLASSHNCYLKIIIAKTMNQKVQIEEFKMACEIISKINPALPVVCQPALYNNHPDRRDDDAPSMKFLLEIYDIFKAHLNDVRIISQMHKLMGWL